MAIENLTTTTKRGHHILIVDDDREMARILSAAFEEAGYATTIAQDGNEGLAVAETKSPDLIVLDIICLLYTSPSPRDQRGSRMPSSA